MKIKDEIRELILDRFTWLTTTVAISLPILISSLSDIQEKPGLLLLGIYFFTSLFILINSLYILVARKLKSDILIARSIENIRKDNIEERTTAKYPILQPYAKKGLLLSAALIVISFLMPGFRNVPPSPSPEIPTSTPATAPTQIAFTPTVTVIYKSPMEMNLQPGDVPGLQMTTTQTPLAKPLMLIPEATDQSQLFYVSADQKNQFETNVVIVPEKTNRAPADLFDLAVTKRRPSMKKISEEQPLLIGEQAYIFATTDTCGSGYVLISIRSNVITIAIGCGENVEMAIMEQIGKSIDRNITTSKEDVCNQLNLTPEECSVAGTHAYSLEVKPNSCDVPGFDSVTDSSAFETYVAFVFSQNGILTIYSPMGIADVLEKSGTNTYTGWIIVVITEKGYAVDIKDQGLPCTIHYEKSQIE